MGDPNAPFGFDPVTGRPFSDKSKVVAGLLQLLLGFFFTLGGVGRLYSGNVGLGVAQLVASIVAWASFICGVFLFVPLVVWFGIWAWFIVDGIILLAGKPFDGQGRPLRS
jgi:TM2 domain-containing membrane protein YozV